MIKSHNKKFLFLFVPLWLCARQKQYSYNKRALAIATAVAVTLSASQPAYALFGLPSIVIDPTNLAQNVLTAARTLAMINNQVRQLVNEAQMLTRLDKQLLQLGFTVAPQIKADLAQINKLIGAATAIAFQVKQTERSFAVLFPRTYTSSDPTSQMILDARARFDTARNAWHDSMVVQSQIAESLPTDTTHLDDLVNQSQSAVGQLEATQAGNQLVALNAKQALQLQQLMAAHFRADSIDRAKTNEADEAGREQYRRFLGNASAYTGP